MGMQKESDRWHFSDSEVKRFFATAPRVYSSRSFDMLALPAIFALSRLLVVTPKRIGTAPQRNKIRRQLKELFRTNQSYRMLPFDALIIVKQYALTKTHAELQKKLAEAISSAAERYHSDGLSPRKQTQ